MPTTTSITTTYAGESAGKYISAALLSANTLDQGGITIMPNVKYKEVVKTLNLTSITQNGDCDFVPTGTLTIAERIIEPKSLMVNMQLCKKQFQSDWNAIEMGYSAFDVLPKSFSDYLIAYTANLIAQENEKNIWQGTASAGNFIGFTNILTAANLTAQGLTLPAAQRLTVVAGGVVTASTVITELGRIVDAIPDRLYGNENLKIYVPQNIMKAYVRALGGFSVPATSNAGVNSQGTQWWGGATTGITFDGIPLFMAQGMPSNKAIATTVDNLFFGTGLLNNAQEVKVLDMSDLDGSMNVRLIMRWTAAVQFGILDDIVVYGIV